MTARVFTLPDLGEGLAEAELIGWLVSVGDAVAVDQPVAEVETAKSVVEVPSPFGGIIQTLHGEPGESLRVGSPFVTVTSTADTSDDAPDLIPAPVGADGKDPDAGTRSESAVSGSGNVLVGYGTRDAGRAGRRRRPATGRSLAPVATSTAAAASTATTATTGERDPLRATAVAVISPVVRRLAKTRGVDLARIQATGPAGVITRHDVEAASAPTAPPDAADPGAADPDVDPLTGLRVRESAALSPFRRSVAAVMGRSRSEIPEATVWVDADATELVELRRRITFDDRHPSFSALIGRFAVSALRRYPVLAGRLGADAQALTLFDGINLGFAADTERGLVVPVVRRADTLTLRGLDRELTRLTSAAREGSVTPAELRGSTFTVNNYGTLGVDGSAAIINHPEVAILGAGRMLERAWVVDGAIVPRTIMQLSLVFDHRVCDGGVAAGFLRMIADSIEHPYDAFGDL